MMAFWAATGGSEEGFKIADRWCAKWEGYDANKTRQRWEAISKSPPNRIGAGTIFYLADRASPGWRAALKPTSLDDFVAYLPAHNYIFLPTREPWPASSVDSQLPPVPELHKDGNAVLDKKGKPMRMPAHTWLDKNRPVQQMTWSPGSPVLIENKLVADGGWIDRRGATCLNLYRPPTPKLGNAAEAKPWVDLVQRVYPDECEHIIKYFAQRAQHPDVKINHCVVQGGSPASGRTRSSSR
jgi:Primase C terminal 2 (PriCT-2)